MDDMTDKELRDLREHYAYEDPIFYQIYQFALDPKRTVMAVEYPEPGTVIGDKVFVEVEGINEETMYHKLYNCVLRGKWLKKDMWVKKTGRITTIYKYDPKSKVEVEA